MTEMSLEIKMHGLLKTIRKAPREFAIALRGAGREAGTEIIETQGLKSYPPATSANMPPTPYYIRGRGMQYANSNDGRSERYGTQWNIKIKPYGVIIGNRASYAPFVGGDPPALHMSRKGWKSLVGIGRSKIGVVRRIYELWIARAIKRAGFK
jgi:hypothetical protein